MVAAATEYSEFRINDLMNHERPVSLYLSVPYESRDRLKPIVRLILNQIIHKLTAELAFRDGRPVSPHRRPMLLMLDEFPLLGRFEVFSEALAHMAGFGLPACIMAQDLTQIYNAYGHNESITSNCDTKVAFTPNKIETNEQLSRLIGETTVRTGHTTVSTRNASTSESESRRPLMTPDEVRRLDTTEALIFTRGKHPIRAKLLRYFDEPYFKRLAEIAPPQTSDRTITAPPSVAGKTAKTPVDTQTAESSGAAHSVTAEPTRSEPPRAKMQVSFLKYAANGSTEK